MLGLSLFPVVWLFATWTAYQAAGVFPSLRNRTCRIVSVICPILLLALACYRVDGSFGIIFWPIQWIYEARGKELAGLLLAFWIIFTVPTFVLTFLAGGLRLSLLNQNQSK